MKSNKSECQCPPSQVQSTYMYCSVATITTAARGRTRRGELTRHARYACRCRVHVRVSLATRTRQTLSGARRAHLSSHARHTLCRSIGVVIDCSCSTPRTRRASQARVCPRRACLACRARKAVQISQPSNTRLALMSVLRKVQGASRSTPPGEFCPARSNKWHGFAPSLSKLWTTYYRGYDETYEVAPQRHVSSGGLFA
jgi:hypothetical protein